MKTNANKRNTKAERRAGFTLVEVMLATCLFGIVMAALLGIFTTSTRECEDTNLALNTSHAANMTMERIVYGYGYDLGLRSTLASSVTTTVSSAGWDLRYTTADGASHELNYSKAQRQILYANLSNSTNFVNLGQDISDSTITNSGGGLTLSLTVRRTKGKFSSGATMSTFAFFRN